jgi:hypothetical protein
MKEKHNQREFNAKIKDEDAHAKRIAFSAIYEKGVEIKQAKDEDEAEMYKHNTFE